jgi:hypothetical protein
MKCTMMITTAVMLIGTTLTVSSAMADMYVGPVQNGNQCWVFSPNGYHFEYGYWGACPAAAVATVVHHGHHHHMKAGA